MVSGTLTLFAMKQNYPNTFIPAVTIGYQIPQDGMRTLTVFGEAGRQVSVLVNEEKEEGYHTVVFDGGNFASGEYFARLQYDGRVKTKKLMLVK